MSTTDLIAILGAVAGLGGVLFGVFSSRAALRASEMTWTVRVLQLIQPSLWNQVDITVLFQGHPANDLALCTFVLANTGYDVIDRKSLFQSDPLRIEPSDPQVRIVSVRVLPGSNPASKALFTETEQSITISFDYLLPNQGLAVEIICAGSARPDLRLAGALTGPGKLRYIPAGPRRGVDALVRAFDKLDMTPNLPARTIQYGVALAIVATLLTTLTMAPATFVTFALWSFTRVDLLGTLRFELVTIFLVTQIVTTMLLLAAILGERTGWNRLPPELRALLFDTRRAN